MERLDRGRIEDPQDDVLHRIRRTPRAHENLIPHIAEPPCASCTASGQPVQFTIAGSTTLELSSLELLVNQTFDGAKPEALQHLATWAGRPERKPEYEHIGGWGQRYARREEAGGIEACSGHTSATLAWLQAHIERIKPFSFGPG